MHRSYKAMRRAMVATITALTVASVGVYVAPSFASESQTSEAEDAAYLIQPGDVLAISVWKEPDLQAEVLVRPDGGLSFPLAGDLVAVGQSISGLQSALTERLKKYIPDPVVTISVKSTSGSRVYVVGKVNRPGEFPLTRPIDVMQAISLAGGATPFAALNGIRILRRAGERQISIAFRYGDVERGRRLDQNILLKSGDTVVVP